jgi:hypothetical protein
MSRLPILKHLFIPVQRINTTHIAFTLPKGCHLDVVGGPSTPHDPESDAGGSLSSWQPSHFNGRMPDRHQV